MPHAFDDARYRILNEWEREFLRASLLRDQLCQV
jgi:hypothetical protein